MNIFILTGSSCGGSDIGRFDYALLSRYNNLTCMAVWLKIYQKKYHNDNRHITDCLFSDNSRFRIDKRSVEYSGIVMKQHNLTALGGELSFKSFLFCFLAQVLKSEQALQGLSSCGKGIFVTADYFCIHVMSYIVVQ